MPRFRSSRTGSVIVTDPETAARMGHEWQPVGEAKAEPKPAAEPKPRKPSK